MMRSSTFKVFATLLLVISMAGFANAQFGGTNFPIVNGTVTLDGNPVPDFTVMVSAVDTALGFPFLPITTDENGFFEHNLIQGTFKVATFDSFSYEPFETEITVSWRDTATVDIALTERVQDQTVEGSVTFDGTGQADVMIYFFKIDDSIDLDDFTQIEAHYNPEIHVKRWASYKTMTDDAGNFSLGMLNGKYVVYVPESETLLAEWMAFEVPTTDPVSIMLKEKKHISGMVTNAEHYSWISVTAFPVNSGRPTSAYVDTLDNYSITVAPGTYVLRLQAFFEMEEDEHMYVEYYSDGEKAYLPKDATQIPVTDMDVTGKDFVLPVPEIKTFTISGTVTSEQNPLDSALVTFVSYNHASNLHISYETRTDEKGQYTIMGKTILDEDSLLGFAAKEGYFAEFYENEATFLTADPIIYHPDDDLTINFDLAEIDTTAGYRIFGNVIDYEDNVIPYGQVTAYTTDTNIGQVTTEIDSNGYYDFGSIFVDNSTIFLQAWGGFEYLPTFYDGKDSWNTADPIEIDGADFQADILMQKKEPRRMWLGELRGTINHGQSKSAAADAFEGDMVYIKRSENDAWQEVDYVDENGKFTLPFETSTKGQVSYDLLWTSSTYGDQQKSIAIKPHDQTETTSFEITSIDNDFAPVVTSNKLYDAYPNPFNPTTKIRVDMLSSEKVSLVIYDITGRKVKTLYDGVLPAGSKTLTWNGQDEFGTTVSSGLYFYQLKSQNVVKTKSLIFLK